MAFAIPLPELTYIINQFRMIFAANNVYAVPLVEKRAGQIAGEFIAARPGKIVAMK
jgi:hypothetical protein